MKKCIRRMVAVILLILVIFFFQRLVMPKYTSGIVEGGFTKEYYNEKNPHQVVMIGDCELYENFSTATLWEEYGITSYIRGSAEQLTWQSYYLLEDTLKYETPQVVVFNVLELMFDELQKEEYNRMTLDGMRWSKTKFDAISSSMLEDEHMVDYLFPILRFHSRITDLTKEDVQYLFKDKQRTTAGYYMRVDVNPYEKGIWGEDEEEYPGPLGKNAMKYLDKIRKLCDEKGIKLLLVKAPSIYPVWFEEWDQQIVKYADENNLQYVNFLNLVDELEIDYSKDTYDQGLHMNLSGAEKCADYLGKILKDDYGLKDLHNNKVISEDWDQKINFYNQMKKSQYEEIKKYGEILNY